MHAPRESCTCQPGDQLHVSSSETLNSSMPARVSQHCVSDSTQQERWPKSVYLFAVFLNLMMSQRPKYVGVHIQIVCINPLPRVYPRSAWWLTRLGSGSPSIWTQYMLNETKLLVTRVQPIKRLPVHGAHCHEKHNHFTWARYSLLWRMQGAEIVF